MGSSRCAVAAFVGLLHGGGALGERSCRLLAWLLGSGVFAGELGALRLANSTTLSLAGVLGATTSSGAAAADKFRNSSPPAGDVPDPEHDEAIRVPSAGTFAFPSPSSSLL